jgi:hypothetical protein
VRLRLEPTNVPVTMQIEAASALGHSSTQRNDTLLLQSRQMQAQRVFSWTAGVDIDLLGEASIICQRRIRKAMENLCSSPSDGRTQTSSRSPWFPKVRLTMRVWRVRANHGDASLLGWPHVDSEPDACGCCASPPSTSCMTANENALLRLWELVEVLTSAHRTYD